MPSTQKLAGAEDAERALSRDQPSAAAAAVPTPANNGSASADGAEVISEEHQQNPLGNDDLLSGHLRSPILFHRLSCRSKVASADLGIGPYPQNRPKTQTLA